MRSPFEIEQTTNETLVITQSVGQKIKGGKRNE